MYRDDVLDDREEVGDELGSEDVTIVSPVGENREEFVESRFGDLLIMVEKKSEETFLD